MPVNRRKQPSRVEGTAESRSPQQSSGGQEGPPWLTSSATDSLVFPDMLTFIPAFCALSHFLGAHSMETRVRPLHWTPQPCPGCP